jgi:hypothetical protein
VCSCGKRTYKANDARKIAKRMNHDQANDWPVYAYHCEDGGGFHIGHVPGRDRSVKSGRSRRRG